MTEHVFFVHGLFMTGAESVLLRRHLARELGAQTHTFLYMGTAERLDAVAERLARKVATLDGPVHLVGHSLGGLVVLRAIERASDLPPGRVVLLGCPVAGSSAAAAVSRVPVLNRILGRNCAVLTVAAQSSEQSGHDVGVIAGSRPAGVGQFFARFNEPNDGTVAVRETELGGAVDRIVLPVSHTGMLVSRRVAGETAHFLRHGRFSLAASS